MISKLFSLLAALFLSLQALAQRPTHVPSEDEPLRVFESVESVIFYIVLPIIIIVLYVIWKRRQRREEAEKQQEKE